MIEMAAGRGLDSVRENQFMGKVFDEWIADSQEFVRQTASSDRHRNYRIGAEQVAAHHHRAAWSASPSSTPPAPAALPR